MLEPYSITVTNDRHNLYHNQHTSMTVTIYTLIKIRNSLQLASLASGANKMAVIRKQFVIKRGQYQTFKASQRSAGAFSLVSAPPVSEYVASRPHSWTL